jgi:Fe-S-cluster-containing hydrogenase component 2
MPAIVESENCTGCKDCETACPNESVKVVQEKAVVNNDECIECNACVDACTHNAMSMG